MLLWIQYCNHYHLRRVICTLKWLHIAVHMINQCMYMWFLYSCGATNCVNSIDRFKPNLLKIHGQNQRLRIHWQRTCTVRALKKHLFQVT